MNFEFVFVVFCLTIIALVAITYNQGRIAEVATKAISGFASNMRGLIRRK
jgi:hypothetical protein